MKAVSYLIQKSFDVSSTHVEGNVAARAYRGKMTTDRGDATNRALKMFLARNTKETPLHSSITEWLSNVEKQLRDWQARELVD